VNFNVIAVGDSGHIGEKERLQELNRPGIAIEVGTDITLITSPSPSRVLALIVNSGLFALETSGSSI
jgi:hypothetical protein